MKEIKNCPFCNSKVHLEQSDDIFLVICYGCKIRTPFLTSEVDAVELWNRRERHEDMPSYQMLLKLYKQTVKDGK